MKFAIRHDDQNHFLKKNDEEWVNELTEETVYTGAEVAARLRDITFSLWNVIAKRVRVVGVEQSPITYHEMPR